MTVQGSFRAPGWALVVTVLDLVRPGQVWIAFNPGTGAMKSDGLAERPLGAVQRTQEFAANEMIHDGE